MQKENEPENRDDANQVFIQTVNQALDKSLDDIDELSLQRLKNARVKALSTSSRSKWIALSAAASIAALLLIPVATQHFSNKATIDSELEIAAQDIPLSAEEMDDIDMLMALEDTDA
ncbi:hypothetical protein [Cellvibrio sp.]|uniref:hypothetical protein n=1 Tax=Cellvibrio sp. TaxID=1965322 RepID=UPI00396481E8